MQQGKVLGMDAKGGPRCTNWQIPLLLLLAYIAFLRSASSSQGRIHSVNHVLGTANSTGFANVPVCSPFTLNPTRFCILLGLFRGEEVTVASLWRASQGHHYLSVMMCVKGAGDIIHEFIIRNYLSGVDHFYIYDDNEGGEENITEILRPFAPLVTIAVPPQKDEFLASINITNPSRKSRIVEHRQHMMYMHGFLTYGSKTTWMLPIDADEFLEAKDPMSVERETGVPFRDVPFMQIFLQRIEKTTPAQSARWDTVLTNRRILPPFPTKGQTLSESYPIACGIIDNFRSAGEVGTLFSAKTVTQPKYDSGIRSLSHRAPLQ